MDPISTPVKTTTTMSQGDTLLIARLGSVITTTGNGVNGTSQGNLQIEGTVAAYAMNSFGATFTGVGNQVSVTKTGYLSGTTAGLWFSSATGQNHVTSDGTIQSTGNVAISVTGGGNVFKFLDSSVVQSANYGLYVQNGNNGLENAGLLNGVSMKGGANIITNEGTILGKAAAALEFAAGGSFSTENQVTNYGTMRATADLTNAINAGAPKLVMFNSGVVESVLDDAISALTNTGGSQITNTGWIVGAKHAIDMGPNAVDYIMNNGVVQGEDGAVFLYGGNDTYDGTNGTTIGRVEGGSGDDTLTGGITDDTLVGGSNNDTLDGGGGSDKLNGGIDNDTYALGSEASGVDQIIETNGIDTITSRISRNLSFADYSEIERLTLQGNAAIDGAGNGNVNILVGNGAANTLNTAGGAGADTLYGLGGNDKYIIKAGDIVDETFAGSSGTDTVFTAANYTLPTNVENLTLTSFTAQNGRGNGLANAISGNAYTNILTGGGLNDTLSGGDGVDYFDFNLASDSTVAARDTITDFQDFGDVDLIDLRDILPGDPATTKLSFGGNLAAFTATNQVIFSAAGAHIVVSVNLDADSAAEMQILLLNTTVAQIQGTDFLL